MILPMKAWLLDRMGDGVDGLHVGELPDPTPRENEVVLDVLYAGLNPADRYLAENLYPARPTFPHVLGRDGMGVVRAVGPGVRDIKVSDKMLLLRGDVGINRPGMFVGRSKKKCSAVGCCATAAAQAFRACGADGAATPITVMARALAAWDGVEGSPTMPYAAGSAAAYVDRLGYGNGAVIHVDLPCEQVCGY